MINLQTMNLYDLWEHISTSQLAALDNNIDQDLSQEWQFYWDRMKVLVESLEEGKVLKSLHLDDPIVLFVKYDNQKVHYRDTDEDRIKIMNIVNFVYIHQFYLLNEVKNVQ